MRNQRKKPKSEKILTEPQPGTFGICKHASAVAEETEDSLEDDSEVCCACKVFTPAELRLCTSITFIKNGGSVQSLDTGSTHM